MHRTVFEDARYAAFMKHDRYYTLQLINHLVSRGVQLSGATDLTEQDIQDQLQAEFPWFLVSMYATGFETIERISNGRTTLEKQGDEMQETYEMQLANPELLENERAKWRAKWDSDGTSDIMKRAARSSAHGKMVDADKVRKILTDLIGNDNGLGVVDRMMREMGYR
ncbi:hypothetical protein BDQ17DRAFT_1364503 [Cyathus striatus]|nr:hypothetical protein BDQ17DRAFT_1364503 [Cyathus striatus]